MTKFQLWWGTLWRFFVGTFMFGFVLGSLYGAAFGILANTGFIVVLGAFAGAIFGAAAAAIIGLLVGLLFATTSAIYHYPLQDTTEYQNRIKDIVLISCIVVSILSFIHTFTYTFPGLARDMTFSQSFAFVLIPSMVANIAVRWVAIRTARWYIQHTQIQESSSNIAV